jgi:hypothetical protein
METLTREVKSLRPVKKLEIEMLQKIEENFLNREFLGNVS